MPRRILCIGDPHFRLDNAIVTDQMETVLRDYVKSTRPDLVIVLGDILDTHERTDIRPTKRAGRFLLMLAELIPTYCLIGNHDILNDNQYLSQYHSLVLLELTQPANLVIVSKPLRVDDIVLVPYVPKNRFKEALATVGVEVGFNSQIRAIFAHQEIKGAQLGCQVSSIEEDWPAEAPPVFSGHIHDYQRVQPNWIYVGTPFPHSFGECERKTVSLITLLDLPMEPVKDLVDNQVDNQVDQVSQSLSQVVIEDQVEGKNIASETAESSVLTVAPEVATVMWTEERLHLPLPGKKLQHFNIEQVWPLLDTWQPDVNMLYKWKITGRRVEIQRLTKDPRYVKILHYVRAEYEYIDATVETKVSSAKFRSYLEILAERVATVPLAQQYLQSLLAAAPA